MSKEFTREGTVVTIRRKAGIVFRVRFYTEEMAENALRFVRSRFQFLSEDTSRRAHGSGIRSKVNAGALTFDKPLSAVEFLDEWVHRCESAGYEVKTEMV